jgi:hypothetical protein
METTLGGAQRTDIPWEDLRTVRMGDTEFQLTVAERWGDAWQLRGALAERLGPSKPHTFEDDVKEVLVEVIDHLRPAILILEGEQSGRMLFTGADMHHLRALCLRDQAS